jgi:hypothetical protein
MSKDRKAIIVYDLQENCCRIFTTKTSAASAYGITSYMVLRRIKSHKKWLKRYLFFEAIIERDQNKTQNKANSLFARTNDAINQ